ncbi:hypothetical protein MY1884_004533 [Beauveria asiatica]
MHPTHPSIHSSRPGKRHSEAAFISGSAPRAIAPAGNDMTRAKCETKCWSEGYQYVGFKAGTECWCGHYIDGSHTPFQSDCSAPCAGNSSESCGGDKVYNVLEGNDPPFTPAPRTPTSTTTARPSTSTAPPASETAFLLMSHAKADCTGDVANEVLVRSDSEGMCIDTDCQVASLDVASLGSCPDGQVQISYWQQPACSGAWYGYGYSTRHACRQLWSGGWSFKSPHLRCAKQGDDCVSKKTCTPDPEPARGICSAQADTPAFKFKSRYRTDCTGGQHNDVTIQSDTDGACVDLDCQVGSLDIAAEGKCPNGQVQISYWEKTGCQGAWYGYGRAGHGGRVRWTYERNGVDHIGGNSYSEPRYEVEEIFKAMYAYQEKKDAEAKEAM